MFSDTALRPVCWKIITTFAPGVLNNKNFAPQPARRITNILLTFGKSAMNGQITEFIKHHYRHFNAAALIDAAEGYKRHLDAGGKMMIALAGAMSTAELGLSLAEMIRQDKVQIISCTGANLEEDLFNLVAHDFYERVPHYRDLTPQDEQELANFFERRVSAYQVAVAGEVSFSEAF